MKTRLFLIFALVLSGIVTTGQRTAIELTFTAIDSVNYVRLDSIKVMNRTQGGVTTTYWPDTTVSLEVEPGDLLLYVGYTTISPVGTLENNTGIPQFHLYQNYPNPAKEQSLIPMYLPEKGNVNVSVTDLQGREVLVTGWQLEQGHHSFRFIKGESNLYFITAHCNGISRSIKIIATGPPCGQRCTLDYAGNINGKPAWKAFSKTGNPVLKESGIIDFPESDESYTFQFASCIPCPGTPTVDYEGQVYNTIQIFSQCWLKENLNIGEMIPGTTGQLNNGTVEKYCYGDNEANCDTYGGLYQWEEMMHYSSGQFVKGLCPPGWHLPLDEEWKVLEGAVDSQYGFGDPEWDGQGYRGLNLGSSLKESGTTHWNPPNWGANNCTGFTGLPGGYREYNTGDFTALGSGGSFWSSSQDGGNVWYRALNYASPHVYRETIDKSTGYSVRCLKGCAPVEAFAGADGATCEGMPYTLSGATASNYASLLWTTSGTGTFNDPTLLNPVYTPSQDDLYSAEVTLTLTASGGGECPDAESAMTLMIHGAPSADAGADEDICSTQNSYALSGMAANYSSVHWSTNGTGAFNNPTALNATYSPSEADKDSGLVTLTLTANGNVLCGPVSDAMSLFIWTGTADAGPDQLSIPGTFTTLSGNPPTYGNGLWQIVSGTGGNIDDPQDPFSVFHGISGHEYTLAWTISNAVCGTSMDEVVISFFICGMDWIYEGQSYATVYIGPRCWLAENLNIGTMINSTNNGFQQTDNGVIEKYCYNNDEAYCEVYGGIYEWTEAVQYDTNQGVQGICPEGWHIAKETEWEVLEATFDSQYPVGDPEWGLEGWRGLDAGGNLKEAGNGHWNAPNTGATNSSGFTGLPGGYRTGPGFLCTGTHGYWWTSTQHGLDAAWCRGLGFDTPEVFRDDFPKSYGLSVRCQRD
jgi:uncharacterized protein (TIGR02145 family)